MTQALLNLDATNARDKALDRLQTANEQRIARAVREIRKVAPLLREFTTDDLFPDPAAWDFTDPRAIGAVMQQAKRLGLIKPTDRVRNSNQSTCHARPKRVWVAA